MKIKNDEDYTSLIISDIKCYLNVGTSVSNLKAMFEKKPAENPFPALKKVGSNPVGATKAEEKKVEQPAPQSISNLKSVFEKKIATAVTEQLAPTKCNIFLK